MGSHPHHITVVTTAAAAAVDLEGVYEVGQQDTGAGRRPAVVALVEELRGGGIGHKTRLEGGRGTNDGDRGHLPPGCTLSADMRNSVRVGLPYALNCKIKNIASETTPSHTFESEWFSTQTADCFQKSPCKGDPHVLHFI